MKETYEECKDQTNPERTLFPLFHQIVSTLPPIQHNFLSALWIKSKYFLKSKYCSFWKETGLVRTFRIQSQYSEDFQVSRAPKNPSILIYLEWLDNVRVPRATPLSLNHFSRWLWRSRCWPRSTTTNMICGLWNTANISYKRFPDQRKVKHFIRWLSEIS